MLLMDSSSSSSRSRNLLSNRSSLRNDRLFLGGFFLLDGLLFDGLLFLLREAEHLGQATAKLNSVAVLLLLVRAGLGHRGSRCLSRGGNRLFLCGVDSGCLSCSFRRSSSGLLFRLLSSRLFLLDMGSFFLVVSKQLANKRFDLIHHMVLILLVSRFLLVSLGNRRSRCSSGFLFGHLSSGRLLRCLSRFPSSSDRRFWTRGRFRVSWCRLVMSVVLLMTDRTLAATEQSSQERFALLIVMGDFLIFGWNGRCWCRLRFFSRGWSLSSCSRRFSSFGGLRFLSHRSRWFLVGMRLFLVSMLFFLFLIRELTLGLIPD
ncbi:hypothetical protein BX666DRAFT_1931635 [Dichotomocladium elegans]|nr:hypothetical protein BX666DRAFT_1931635 [Dichotomocladium elegans]